jgi:tight adherence protein C
VGLIATLLALACTGSLMGLYLLRQGRVSRTAALIASVEGRAEVPGSRLLPASLLDSYDQRLLQTGRPYGLDARQFMGLKIAGATLLPALGLTTWFNLGQTALLLTGLCAIVGFVAPDAWLGARLAAVRRQVAEELPLVADLIATAVSAGLPLSEAIRQVAQDVPGLVAREFLRAVQEMAAGKPRAQAWRDLMARVPGEDLRTIVQAIMQAEQYGTSVAEILRYQVQQMRLFKQQEAQRIAQATSVKMRVPMLLLILFPFMVLLLGPALLQIAVLLK